MAYLADVIVVICLLGMLATGGMSFYHMNLGYGRYSRGCMASLIYFALVITVLLIGRYSHFFLSGG